MTDATNDASGGSGGSGGAADGAAGGGTAGGGEGIVRVRFPQISPRSFEHPADRGAMATLRVTGVAPALQAVAGLWSERAERLFALASAVRVSERQYGRIHALRSEAAEILDLDPVPDLFVTRHPVANAYAIGIDRPFVVLTTGLVESLDDDGLRCVVGHELGHVLSGHNVLRTLLMRLLRLQATVQWVPLGALGLRAVIAALMEWFRKAELTADRAGLLCSQDPAAAVRQHLYLAGATDLDQADVDEFMQQAAEFEAVDDLRDSLLKLLVVEGMSHPFAVVRAAQLQRWADSDEYPAILGGEYLRRQDDRPAASLMDDLRSAGRSYRTAWTASEDPLTKVFTDVGEAVAGAAGRLRDFFLTPPPHQPPTPGPTPGPDGGPAPDGGPGGGARG